jgi:hypothetical protein
METVKVYILRDESDGVNRFMIVVPPQGGYYGYQQSAIHQLPETQPPSGNPYCIYGQAVADFLQMPHLGTKENNYSWVGWSISVFKACSGGLD